MAGHSKWLVILSFTTFDDKLAPLISWGFNFNHVPKQARDTHQRIKL